MRVEVVTVAPKRRLVRPDETRDGVSPRSALPHLAEDAFDSGRQFLPAHTATVPKRQHHVEASTT
jgi:hypothetical protein